MASSIRSFLPLAGTPEAVIGAFRDGDPVRWLPVLRRDGPEAYTLELHAGALHRRVTARVGQPWRAGASHWRSLSWDPAADAGEPNAVDRLLPSLDGELGINLAKGGLTLILDARYQPPGGPIGTAVDAVALHRVAQRTCQRFLEEVAAKLGEEVVLRERTGVSG